jgi:hypothetical protein
VSQVGSRARQVRGSAVGNFRWSRIRTMTARSVMTAIIRSRSPQRGHANTSMPQTRWRRVAQSSRAEGFGRTGRSGADAAAPGVAASSVGVS